MSNDNNHQWFSLIAFTVIISISATAIKWINKPQQAMASSDSLHQKPFAIPSDQLAATSSQTPSARYSQIAFQVAQRETTPYPRLDRLLREQKWRAADQETLRIMLESANREQVGRLDIPSIQDFSCTVLLEVDRLWMKHSNSRFGFSPQANAYSSNSGDPNNESWRNSYGEQVGWRVGGNWISQPNLTSVRRVPPGHLPFEVWRTWGGGFAWIPPFVTRLRTCQNR